MKKLSYYIIALVVFGIAIVGGWTYVKYFKKETSRILSFSVERKDIDDLVRVRGDVTSKKEYTLSFASSGIVSDTPVVEGQLVVAGDVLMKINTSDLDLEQKKLELQQSQAQAKVGSVRAQLNQARASLLAQQAKLDELRRGTRQEELDVARTAVDNAESSLESARTSYANALNLSETELAQATEAKSDAEINLQDVTTKADLDLSSLYTGVKDVIADAYTRANNAVNVQTNQLFNNPNSSSPTLTFVTTDTQAKTDSENKRIVAGQAVTDIQSTYSKLSDYQSGRDSALMSVNGALLVIRDFLTRLNDAVNSASSASSTTISLYKGYVNTALTDVNSAISSVSNRRDSIALQKQVNQNSINSASSALNSANRALQVQEAANTTTIANASRAVTEAENALKSAQSQYNLLLAGATPEAIRAQEAVITQTQANVASYESELQQAITAVEVASTQIAIVKDKIEKATLRAPENGRIVKLFMKKGEVVVPGQNVLSFFVDGYQIQADISELEIHKIKAGNGNTVRIVFDAFPGKEYKGSVITINPREVVKEGDSYYRVTIAVELGDDDIRSGMKADLVIVTGTRTGVLAIPQIAVTKRDKLNYVTVKDGRGYRDVVIETGVSDGQDIEIIGGLQEGQTVYIGAE